MTGSVALDVVIGLVFIFLLYSLLASIIQEMIANFFGLRARNLKQGIVRMLEDEPSSTRKNIISDIFSDIKQSILRIFSNNETGLLKRFYSQPSIKYLASGKFFSKPSYISEANFSKAIMDILKEESEGETDLKKIENTLGTTVSNSNLLELIKVKIKEDVEDPKKVEGIKVILNDSNSLMSENTRKHIRSLLNDAQNDLVKFKVNLENWFNDTMERTTGWYKRTNQLMLFIIGFGIAVSFNISTIEIAKKLSKDDKVRDQMVQLAMATAKEMSNNNKDVKKKI